MNKAKILNEKRKKAYAARLKQLEQFNHHIFMVSFFLNETHNLL